MNDIKKQDLLNKKQECNKFIKEDILELFKDEDIRDYIVIGVKADGGHQLHSTDMWGSELVAHLEIAKHIKLQDIT